MNQILGSALPSPHSAQFIVLSEVIGDVKAHCLYCSLQAWAPTEATLSQLDNCFSSNNPLGRQKVADNSLLEFGVCPACKHCTLRKQLPPTIALQTSNQCCDNAGSLSGIMCSNCV